MREKWKENGRMKKLGSKKKEQKTESCDWGRREKVKKAKMGNRAKI